MWPFNTKAPQPAPDIPLQTKAPQPAPDIPLQTKAVIPSRRSEKPRRTNIGRRNYQAAKINRLTDGWTTQAKHPDEVVKENLRILRARSRDQFANNDYMSRFVALTKSNVVGPKGITLNAVSRNSRGELDAADNAAIEAAWSEWGRVGNCDLSGQLSFTDVQRLFIGTVIVDGEFLAEEVYRGPHGYSLSLLDPAALDIEHNRADLRNGNTIRFSIEFDRYMAPVAYYLRDDSLSMQNYSYGGRRYRRVDANKIIHCFIRDRVNQKRGIPAASTAMLRMEMLSGYEDAAITAARVGASKMGFFTSPGGDEYTGDDTEDGGALITDVEPGTFEQLPGSVDFTPFDPDYPHQQFADFVKTCLRGISSGLGVSYNSLANDLEGVNYSSIRAGTLEDREAWKALQEWMIECFMRRVYTNWLGSALALGKVLGPAGNALPFARIDKFKQHAWQARRWNWVDPLKDYQASVIAIENGLKSRTEVIKESGRDPEDVWSELEKEKDRLQGLLPEETNPTEVAPDDEEV